MDISWRRLAPAALLVGFAFFVFAPVLFFGRAFFGEEQFGFYYAISYFVDQWVQVGVPHWQGAYFGGVPTSLDQFYGAFYPPNLALFSLFDFFFAHHLSITLATAAGLLFAHWFGRLQGWGNAASITFALGYFSATTYAWLQIGTLAAHSFAVLPAMLVAVHYAAHSRRWRVAILGGGVALGIGFLAGFMQIVFYNYVIAGLYALFLDWERVKSSRENSLVEPMETATRGLFRGNFLRSSLSYVGMTLLGLLIGLNQFLPSAALIDSTIRTSTYAVQNATYPNVTEFIAFVLPPYFSVPFFGGGGAAGFYVGALGLVCAVLALTHFRTRAVLFFAGIYMFVMALAFRLPLFGWLNEHVPPFSHMGGNFRWSIAAAFPLAYLAAAGVEGLLRSGLSHRALNWIIGICASIVAALVGGSLALQAAVSWIAASPEMPTRLVAWYTGGRALVYPPEHYLAIFSKTLGDVSAQFALFSPRFAFGVLLWVLVLGFFVWYRRGATRYALHAVVAIFLVTASGTAVLQWSDFVPQSLYAEEPQLSKLLHKEELDQHAYRVLGYVVGDGMFAQLADTSTLTPAQNTVFQRESLANNSNLFWDIDRMDGMEPYRTLRANRLLNTVVAHDSAAYVFDDASPRLKDSALDQLYNRDVQKQVPIGEKLADFKKRLPLISMMNVKYVYSPYALSAPGLLPLAVLRIGERVPVDLHVYENTRVLPRAYFSTGQHFAAGEREALIATVGAKDFARETIIECVACAAHAGGTGEIEVAGYKSGRVELATEALGARWLVLSESHFPGWRAYIDGKETPIHTANYLFQAIEVPEGQHQIVFEYKDRFTFADLLR
ncbi:MAG: YfhO family protein [Patescibacteria group bacterium]